MTRDWRAFTDGLRLVSGNRLRIELEGRRKHDVYVIEHSDGWELSGESADAASLEAAGLDAAELWRRNRDLDLVGYVVDGHGTAWVTAWLPFEGVTREEFQTVVHDVALEADRLEFHCTGRDQL